jgi:hypothetical protein
VSSGAPGVRCHVPMFLFLLGRPEKFRCGRYSARVVWIDAMQLYTLYGYTCSLFCGPLLMWAMATMDHMDAQALAHTQPWSLGARGPGWMAGYLSLRDIM